MTHSYPIPTCTHTHTHSHTHSHRLRVPQQAPSVRFLHSPSHRSWRIQQRWWWPRTSCPRGRDVNDLNEKLSVLVGTLHVNTHAYMHNICTYMHEFIRTYTTHSHSYHTQHTGIVQIGRKTHYRTHTDKLRTGPSVRRGRYLSKRGRCVSCVATAPLPAIGGRKTHTQEGKYIPTVCYACDVCRVHLCRRCFQEYDHSSRGKPMEHVILMWVRDNFWLYIILYILLV